ncbi:MAG TPA: PEP-CTERM sorting domain-containing protein [Acetobacteraceae bacterium]|nr:PEP-CTERM sorting domain-containing protein [Acetobacteraceae bacterium]
MYRHPLALGMAGLLTLGAGAAHAEFAFTNIVDPANPTFTQALGINDASTIVGYGNMTIFNGFELVLPPVPANFTRQNVMGADGGTQVVGISGAGTTVGFSITGGVTSGFAQNGGTFTPVKQDAFTQLLGINKSGTVAAGYTSTDPAGAMGQTAVTVSGGPLFTTPVFTNVPLPMNMNMNSQATGVNDAGTIVGFYQYGVDNMGNPLFKSFEDLGGTLTSFQPFASNNSQALGINNLGDIVGDYVDGGGVMHGYLDANNVFTSIDPPGSTATTANGINDNGQIVGFYVSGNADTAGNTIGFLAQVPEPVSLLVFGSGLAGLALVRRRRSARRTVVG